MSAVSNIDRILGRYAAPALRALAVGATLASMALAQTVSPTEISIPGGSPVCREGSEVTEACIQLPEDSIIDKVDVFFLFDDTGSFASFVPTVTGIFSSLVSDLETALPGVSFGFGVGRFEDYGGPGTGFSFEFASGRPFILNQPIVTADDAGGPAARDGLISAALARTAPGFGGDGPESAIAEGLYQVATGVGFDGDGDGSTTGIGGSQPACSLAAQTGPDNSGDVPAFSTCVDLPKSGTVGGVGYRSTALKLVILASDVCSVAAFDSASGIPATIAGTGSTEIVAGFACTSTTPGANRFGFVSDSLTAAGNTTLGAVVPRGAGTVPDTVAALNAAGIRVLGMVPSGGPAPAGSGPSWAPNVFLSALARLTGATDGGGNPLVFPIGGGGDSLRAAIVNAILTSATEPIDISMATDGAPPAGLGITFDPATVFGVGPGDEACFDVTFSGTGFPNGAFGLDFKDAASGAVLGSIPGSVDCDRIIEVSFDIHPRSCPNPLNCRGGGVIPAAILGSAGLDVKTIDPASIRLAGVAPTRWAIEDVAAPHYQASDDCNDCSTAGPDRFLDLTLKFDHREVLQQIGLDHADRACLRLEVTGNLKAEYGSTPITGKDIVRFQCR